MNYEQWRKQDTRDLLWAVDARVARIEQSIRVLTRMAQQVMRNSMATREEFEQTLQDLRADIARDTEIDSSAVTTLHALADHMITGAASATDLDTFKAEVVAMGASIRSNADSLAAAIADTSGGGGTSTTPPATNTGPGSGPAPDTSGTDPGTSAPAP